MGCKKGLSSGIIDASRKAQASQRDIIHSFTKNSACPFVVDARDISVS
jgi:hypothetical protein